MDWLRKLLKTRREVVYCKDDSITGLLAEIIEAKRNLHYAHQNLNNAEGMFVEVAAREVEFSKSRLNALLKKYREETGIKRLEEEML